jgi:hypothetical protein
MKLTPLGRNFIAALIAVFERRLDPPAAFFTV